MADVNKRKRDDNKDGKAVGSGLGVVPEDTIASALDPFGAAAGAIADGSAKEGTDDDKHSETRD